MGLRLDFGEQECLRAFGVSARLDSFTCTTVTITLDTCAHFDMPNVLSYALIGISA